MQALIIWAVPSVLVPTIIVKAERSLVCVCGASSYVSLIIIRTNRMCHLPNAWSAGPSMLYAHFIFGLLRRCLTTDLFRLILYFLKLLPILSQIAAYTLIDYIQYNSERIVEQVFFFLSMYSQKFQSPNNPRTTMDETTVLSDGSRETKGMIVWQRLAGCKFLLIGCIYCILDSAHGIEKRALSKF